jgi:electron transfer flavoprotein beta subunit
MVTDGRAAASDTLATSHILARAIEHLGSVDVVCCGRQAIDGDTAQVGPQVAEKLGLPQVTFVDQLIEVTPHLVCVRRNAGSSIEKVEVAFPCLLTVTSEANIPRPHGARRLMRYKRALTRSEIEKELGVSSQKKGDGRKMDSLVKSRIAELSSQGLYLEQWGLDTIGADLGWCGRRGSPTKVKRVQGIVLKGSGHRSVDPTREGVHGLVHELISDHTIG